jgi:nucleoid DNA-binding protein
MKELVSIVAAKVGISPDQATSAVTTVLAYLKDRVPAPLGEQIEKAASRVSLENFGNVGKKLGSFFGK